MSSRSLFVAISVSILSVSSYGFELPEWLDDWYQVELIIFQQPHVEDQETVTSENTFARYRVEENLIVEAPRTLATVAHSFSLTDQERLKIRANSKAVDLERGTNPWFYTVDQRHESNAKELDTSHSGYPEFPEWLIAPGASYDPFFQNAFEQVPYGSWFSELALSLLNYSEEDEPADSEESVAIDPDDQALPEDFSELEPIEEARLGLDQFRDLLRQSSYMMDEANVELPRTAQRLRDSGIRVFKHFKWHQYVPGLGAEESVLFQVSEDEDLIGVFSLTKGRFIHLHLHLWWHLNDASVLETRYPVFELNEKRRVRRQEVHYFDHPRLGIIAEVKRVKLPTELRELIDSLD